jgi:LysM repeat protein
VRLTRRGRIVLGVLLAGLVLVAVGLAAAAQAQAASSGSSSAALRRSMTRVVVQPGQTLWSIASRAEPAADPRAVVQQIVDVNALPGTSIQPGQQLWVPKG